MRLTDPRLRRPLLVAFCAMLSVTVSQIIVGFFALDRLHLGPTEAAQAAGIALTTVGVALILAQVVLRQLEWPPLKMIRVGATLAALGFACGALATTAPWLWACYFVAAAGMGFVFPAFSALAANAMHAWSKAPRPVPSVRPRAWARWSGRWQAPWCMRWTRACRSSPLRPCCCW